MPSICSFLDLDYFSKSNLTFSSSRKQTTTVGPCLFAGLSFAQRREDLLKPDVMSEIILLGFGVLILAILVLILVAAWTLAPRLV